MPKQKTRKSQGATPMSKADRELYDRMRREFTAADLQKYTVVEKMIPAEKVLAELVEMNRKFRAKKKAHGGRKRQRRRQTTQCSTIGSRSTIGGDS